MLRPIPLAAETTFHAGTKRPDDLAPIGAVYVDTSVSPFVRWSDDTTPRTDRPFHFIPRAKGRARARIIRQGWDPNSFTIRF